MTFLTFVLITVIVLAVIGLGWTTFSVGVLSGVNKALNVSIPIIKNLTNEAQATSDSDSDNDDNQDSSSNNSSLMNQTAGSPAITEGLDEKTRCALTSLEAMDEEQKDRCFDLMGITDEANDQ
jgi:hypothetical protein